MPFASAPPRAAGRPRACALALPPRIASRPRSAFPPRRYPRCACRRPAPRPRRARSRPPLPANAEPLPQQQAHAKNRARRIGHVLAHQLRRRPVDRLNQRRPVPRAPRRNHANRTRQRRGLVAENVAEKIRRQQHVELLRPQDDLHRRVVHVQMIDRQVARCRRHARHRLPPQPRSRQHVGLVHRRHPPRPNPGSLERKSRDALDLRHAVAGQVRSALIRALAFRLVLAEIDIAHQLADNLEIDLRLRAQPQRAKPAQRLAQLDRPHVRVDAQRLPQRQKARLRPAVQRLRIPLRPAHRAQQHRIRLQAAVQRLLRAEACPH